MLKTTNLSSYLQTASRLAGDGLKSGARIAIVPKKGQVHLPRKVLASFVLNEKICNKFCITSGPGVSTQVRLSHTDVRVPDFSAYRRSEVVSPTAKSSESHDSRKNITYMMVAAGGLATVYSAKSLVTKFVMTLSASADVLAMAKTEIELTKIPLGQSVTFKWRGKPVFVRHRTAEEIAKERAVPVANLRDPEHDDQRAQRPEYLVVIGVCTHLGCIPIADAGDYGGYYCPCHGSHYDGSGRIRKGPAPLNLEVPPHEFVEGLLVIG